MSFTLRVRFAGMCLFIRDGNSRVHVLLPSTAGTFPVTPEQFAGPSGTGCTDPECAACTEAGMTIAPHAVRVTFNTAHLQPGRVSHDRYLAHASLKGSVMEVPRVGAELEAELPPDLVSLGGNLCEEVFTDDAGNVLAARITFQSGGCSGVAPGRCWSWRGTVRRMTHVVEWSIPDIDADELVLPLQQFGGASGGELGPLYPVNGVIDLDIFHAPYSDLPPDPVIPPEPDAANPPVAHHFAAMLRLFQDPVYDLPVYVGNECPQSTFVRDTLEDPIRGTASMTCMGGQA